jgi:hypothetical protein
MVITWGCAPFALCHCSYWSSLGRKPQEASDPGVVISTLGWILVGVAAWLVVATAVGMVIGRTIRLRDRQVFDEPDGPDRPPPHGIPTQDSGGRDLRNGR